MNSDQNIEKIYSLCCKLQNNINGPRKSQNVQYVKKMVTFIWGPYYEPIWAVLLLFLATI